MLVNFCQYVLSKSATALDLVYILPGLFASAPVGISDIIRNKVKNNL
jgi:hypothetical protein